MRFDFISIFPEFCEAATKVGVVGKAIEKNLIQVHFHQIRDHAINRYGQVDDSPYGGGAGMVMSPIPLEKTLGEIPRLEKSVVIFCTPSGVPFKQSQAKDLSHIDQVIFICGRYEGVDQRFIDEYVDLEISIGDFVVSGGETPSLMVFDAVSRLVPGVLGNPESLEQESFQTKTLEYPHFTRPEVWKEKSVPSVLLSGNHKEIKIWREKQSLDKTKAKRPDLLS